MDLAALGWDLKKVDVDTVAECIFFYCLFMKLLSLLLASRSRSISVKKGPRVAHHWLWGNEGQENTTAAATTILC